MLHEIRIIFLKVGIICPFCYEHGVALVLDLIHTEQEGKVLGNEKWGKSSLISFVNTISLVLIYFRFKYEKDISLRNHRKCGKRELVLYSWSTRCFFWSRWSAKSEVSALGEPPVLLAEDVFQFWAWLCGSCLLWEKCYWQALYWRAVCFTFQTIIYQLGLNMLCSFLRGWAGRKSFIIWWNSHLFQGFGIAPFLRRPLPLNAYPCTHKWDLKNVTMVKISRCQICTMFVGGIMHRRTVCWCVYQKFSVCFKLRVSPF